MKTLFEETFIVVGSILIGIPLGFFVGLYCWLRFPLSIYREARVNLAIKRIQEAKDFLEEHGQGKKSQDIWEKHIKRMEEKKSYDN
jgi:hypothetical protein